MICAEQEHNFPIGTSQLTGRLRSPCRVALVAACAVLGDGAAQDDSVYGGKSPTSLVNNCEPWASLCGYGGRPHMPTLYRLVDREGTIHSEYGECVCV